MKCDELEVYDMASNAELSAGYDHHWAYDKDEADEAIAELKEKCEKLTKDHDHAIQACCDADKAIAKLKEEIKRTQEIANEQTFKLCVEKENVWQLELLFQEQKIKRAEAMAKWCAAQYWTMRVKAAYETDTECRLWFIKRYHWWKKWNKHWREIADKLKE